MTWSDIGINVPVGKTGEILCICPKCSHTRKKSKQKCLSVNVDDKVWYCHHCGWSGVLKDNETSYVKPKEVEINISQGVKKYLNGRGISDFSIKRFKITCKSVNNKTWILFPFYKNEQLINYKYRSSDKNFMQEKGAELILWNYDGIKGREKIIITEGIMDALSVFEAGFKNVCSVPNGATSFTFLKNCFEVFDGVKEIIIASDNDEKGFEMRQELSRRLGRYRCKFVEYPEDCKDSNDVLVKHGKVKLDEIIKNAKDFPVDGIIRVRDIEKEADNLYEYGIKQGDKIGFPEFDEHFSFRKGEMTMVTGVPGSGKSQFMDQCLIRLSSLYERKHLIISFENQPISLHVAKLSSIYSGRSFFRKENKMSEEDWLLSKYFIDEHFYFMAMQDVDKTVDGIIEKIKETALRYGIDGCIIDPWNYLEFNLGGLTETQFISKALSKFSLLAKTYDIYLIIIAHPTKMSKDESGEYQVPNLYSISGSSHFFNKTDNGMVIHRNRSTDQVFVHIQKIRWSFSGKLGTCEMNYDVITGRYKEPLQHFSFDIDDLRERLQPTLNRLN